MHPSTMTRKPLTFAIVLLLIVLAPAAAIIGFCTRMSCCSHGADAVLSLTAEGRDCCTTITCYESPSARLTTAGTTSLLSLAMSAIAVNAFALPAPRSIAAPVPIDTSPPTTNRDRLAELSTLLI